MCATPRPAEFARKSAPIALLFMAILLLSGLDPKKGDCRMASPAALETPALA